jgi:hypothetical protein
MLRYFVILAALLAGPLHADRVRDYLAWHEACLASEDAPTIDRYIARYRARLDADPDDHLARVYLGSAHSLRSAESGWGPAKLKHLKRGGQLMDEAVAAAPDDPRVRFVRGVNGYKVPKRFKRRELAVKDFLVVMPLAEKGGHGLSARERQAMLYYAWKTFGEEGHEAAAKRARAACHRIDPESWYGGQTAP